ncbi:hypothetical protein [Streptomyces sp. NPDC058240]|uniref:hypothetical protein n=1 Tax=Streptomyces sp. NPDC058240 TaxID=3346396 RepID=UPI0036ED149B
MQGDDHGGCGVAKVCRATNKETAGTVAVLVALEQGLPFLIRKDCNTVGVVAPIV